MSTKGDSDTDEAAEKYWREEPLRAEVFGRVMTALRAAVEAGDPGALRSIEIEGEWKNHSPSGFCALLKGAGASDAFVDAYDTFRAYCAPDGGPLRGAMRRFRARLGAPKVGDA